MDFWQIFIRVLLRRPLPALGALWWHATRRRVRARNRIQAAGAPLPFAYKFWIRNLERLDDLERRAAETLNGWRSKPEFSVILYCAGSSDEDVARSIRSVELQTYPHANLTVIGHASGQSYREEIDGSWPEALHCSSGDFIVPLRAGDQLSRWALFHFAESLQAEPGAEILYGDEDEMDLAGQRLRPWFKPRWNKELFLARDYLSRACAIRRSIVRRDMIAPDAQLPILRLLLELTDDASRSIVHVPRIVSHVDRTVPQDQAAAVAAVSRQVSNAGGVACVGPFGSVKVSWPLPSEPPLVSILVPTKDKLELLRPCVESVLERTRFEPFELLILDNASVEPQTRAYLRDIQTHDRVRVISYPKPYNFSAINNEAVREAAGSYLCLLNNDTEIVCDDWLSEMMRYAARPDIGAVGAKLLYTDGRIQHAGVVVGVGGAAGHAHRNLPAHDEGYFGQPHLTQYVSAVTAACLLIDKRKFLAVGGFDEERLAIAFNDVDLCLKLERAGWRNIYVPHAVLIHHESKSRGNDYAPGQIDRYRRELEVFQNRWGTKTYEDPLLNPNLDRSGETFVIRF